MRERWEALEPKTQAALAYPVLGVFFFVLNFFAFAQPLGSSVIYGVIEGGVFTGLLILITRSEKSRRGGGGEPPAAS